MICADSTGTWQEASCDKKGQKDAYFASGQPTGGKIPAPSSMQFGCPPMMDASTLHPESRAVRSDSNSTMYASNCDEPPPRVTMNACSGEKPKPKKEAPAPKSGVAQLTLLLPVALIVAQYF